MSMWQVLWLWFDKPEVQLVSNQKYTAFFRCTEAITSLGDRPYRFALVFENKLVPGLGVLTLICDKHENFGWKKCQSL